MREDLSGDSGHNITFKETLKNVDEDVFIFLFNLGFDISNIYTMKDCCLVTDVNIAIRLLSLSYRVCFLSNDLPKELMKHVTKIYDNTSTHIFFLE